MRMSRPVSPGVVAMLLLSLLAVFAAPSVLPERIAAKADPGCVVSDANLVRNGSFEEPGFEGDVGNNYTPDGWDALATDAVSANLAASAGRTTDGDIYLAFLRAGVSQGLATDGLGGASLQIDFISFPGRIPTVSLEGQPLALTTSGVNRYRASYTVPEPAPGTMILAFGGTAFGGADDTSLDGVTVTVADCPVIPPTATAIATSTATATTAPTSTSVPTATATATTIPTAGPTVRPTARPRTTATVPTTATPSVPTVRPTARPRG